MEATIYNNKAKKEGSVKLPDSIFGLSWNGDLVHQVIVSMMGNARQGSTHTKDRSEVRGGGKKPWRQKGTGRARHGSIRSPLWKGGGVTFGPVNEKDYYRKINKKMKLKALNVLLSAKAKENELVFVDSLDLSEPKTKEMKNMLESFSKDFEQMNYDKGRRVLVVTPEKDENALRSFDNIPTAHVEDVRNINPLMVSLFKYVLFVDPINTIKTLEDRSSEIINKPKKEAVKA